MTREEIVTALRKERLRMSAEAADLIENQQNHIAALMQANAALRDTILRRDAQIAEMSEGMAQFAKAVAVEEEVVLCKDCKHYLITGEFESGRMYTCEVNHFSYINNDGDKHFCSYGEQKKTQ